MANLTVGRGKGAEIFHNTTITLTPNELYSTHRLVHAQKDLLPKDHPLNFFLNQLGAPPANVNRADDKFFSLQLAAGDDEATPEELKARLFHSARAAMATAISNIPGATPESIASNQAAIALFDANPVRVNTQQGRRCLLTSHARC